MDKILVFDFGGQTTQLIARRIREIGVYSDVVPGTVPFDPELLEDVKGIVFSGSPYSVYDSGSPKPDEQFISCGLPILGICYGFQLLTEHFGGRVQRKPIREFGRSAVHFERKSALFDGVPDGFVSWMSHGDSVDTLAPGFQLVGRSSDHPAAAHDPEKQLYGIQFHPEVTHCEYGTDVLANFVFRVCDTKAGWSMDAYLRDISEEIRETAGDSKVLLLISGGVDSTVVAGLLLTALDPDSVHLMYIDTGLMRKDETREITTNLERLGATHLHLVDASADFLNALAGIEDPEEKRRIIGDLFITVQQREVSAWMSGDYFLAQGTLYTDMIESGKGVGQIAHVIKSHHNVRSPLVEEKRAAGRVIEPLARLYKDEVRELGRKVGIAEEVIRRHPFPGPGLAVRILGAVTADRCEILREADAIFIEELKRRGLYDEIWQAFCVLLPIRSVGVTGDMREYGWVLALRAIISRDGMTADVYPFEAKDLLEISARITNSVPAVGRVVYDVSSKPPATIEWE